MKTHYFGQETADADDTMLNMAKGQGYVPAGCLLGGVTAMGLVNGGKSPCVGCECPRDKCGGSPKHSQQPHSPEP